MPGLAPWPVPGPLGASALYLVCLSSFWEPMEPRLYMGEDFGLSQAPLLLIYSGDVWLILPCQHGRQNPTDPHNSHTSRLPSHFENEVRQPLTYR